MASAPVFGSTQNSQYGFTGLSQPAAMAPISEAVYLYPRGEEKIDVPAEVHSAAQSCLNETFGFNSFKGVQRKTVCSCILGKNIFLISSTGSGKSLCYQLPGLIGRWTGATFLHGVTVVISPLLSLIKDQTSALQRLSIEAASFSVGSASSKIMRDTFNNLLSSNPTIKFIYMTPERFCSKDVIENLCEMNNRNRLLRVVVDECHCITMWGFQFRQHYMMLGEAMRRISCTNPVPLLALTATATLEDIVAIQKSLNMSDAPLYVNSFYRQNLVYSMKRRNHNDKDAVVKEVLRLSEYFQEGSGIVYCMSRKMTEELTKKLAAKGVCTAAYHAGLPDKLRSEVQEKWMSGEYKVVAATVALGMGVDKPDVRFVVHASISMSLDHYYQETGRAGRDGSISQCLLMYDTYDYEAARRRIDDNSCATDVRDKSLKSLHNMIEYCELKVTCRRQFMVNHFGEIFDRELCMKSGTACDICMRKKEEHVVRVDITDIGKHAVAAVGHGLHMSKGIPRLRLRTLSSVLLGHTAKVPQELLTCKSFGFARHVPEEMMLNIIQQLILLNVLQQFMYRKSFRSEQSMCFLKLSSNSIDVMSQRRKVVIVIHMFESDASKIRLVAPSTNCVYFESQLTTGQRKQRMDLMKRKFCQEALRKKTINVFQVTELCIAMPMTLSEVRDICGNNLPVTAYHSIVSTFRYGRKQHYESEREKLIAKEPSMEVYEGVIVLDDV